MEPKTSLIISTYNNTEALALLLKSVRLQSVLPEEVIVADDGSGEATKELILKEEILFPVPLIHVWQPDEGFRLAHIRNKAVALAKYDYLISIDGDIILHQHFVRDHKAFAEKGCFIQGGRVILFEAASKKILRNGDTHVSYFNPAIYNRHNTISSPFLAKLFTKIRTQSVRRIRGCNASFWKEDLINVNGYNELFVGWGSEDKELAVRLYNSGIKLKVIKFGAVCYHLHHKLKINNRRLERNNQLLKEAQKQKIVKCDEGISKYLS
ncbi:glycosyltransferase family 2 protein [Paludibacter jiangxiensis]|uniref:Glycosyl transferase family 2 n=1 Tax=Paludibacter jiangxiensis TaxID=681398 RepID=A0A171AVQ4_9BACT|nr:glycosyltransferase family 2 protein [Paludibacter jiangxiensis]GAT64346.1 glycosyl transferase family 2 [Paludibacter jiangxiensis]